MGAAVCRNLHTGRREVKIKTLSFLYLRESKQGVETSADFADFRNHQGPQ